jgi:acetyl esterase/lipase
VTCNYRLQEWPWDELRQMWWWSTVGGVLVLGGLRRSRLVVIYLLFMVLVLGAIWICSVEAHPPFHRADIEAAMAFIGTHGTRYRLDTTQTVLLGHSAGAHLVALVASAPRFDAPHVTVRGVVCISGVYSAERLKEVTCGDLLMRVAFGRHDDYGSQFPLLSARADLPPHLILNARWDLTLMRHAWDFVATLRRWGVYVHHRTFDGTHFTIMQDWTGRNGAVWKVVRNFLEQLRVPKSTL